MLAVALEVQLWHRKFALLQVYCQPVVGQDPEDGSQVVHMLAQVPAGHPPII
jgi:hypothetical protein